MAQQGVARQGVGGSCYSKSWTLRVSGGFPQPWGWGGQTAHLLPGSLSRQTRRHPPAAT